MFVEPGRFQDVTAQGKPSFLPGINRLLMAQPAKPGEVGAAHSRPAGLSPRKPPPLPAQPAGWGQDWGRGGLEPRAEPIERLELPGMEERERGPRRLFLWRGA